MRQLNTFFFTALLLFIFVSCNKGKKLERKIDGRWEVKTIEIIEGTSYTLWEDDPNFGTRKNVYGEGFFEFSSNQLTASFSYDVVDSIGTRSRKVESFECPIAVDLLGEFVQLTLDSTDTRGNVLYITDKGFRKFEFFQDRITGNNSFNEKVGKLFRFELKKTK